MNLAGYGYVLPVQTSTGEVIDIAGYTECFKQWVDAEKKEEAYYYIHLPDDRIAPIGKYAASFVDWNDFLSKTFDRTIDQDKAIAVISDRCHCVPTSRIIKRSHGVYLCEDGTTYDCVGYVRHGEENYRDNRDIVRWGYNFVFALSNEGKLRLVSYNDDSHTFDKSKPIVAQIESYSDIVKAVSSATGWELAFLQKNGTVVFVGREIHEYSGWHDVCDIVISHHGLLALTKQGEILYPPEQHFEPRWRSFENIRRETTGKGYFYPDIGKDIDFSSFSHVYHVENYIYGFNEDGKAQVFSFAGEFKPFKSFNLPFELKRMLFYRQKAKYGNVIDRFYFVAKNGTSYSWEVWKEENKYEELLEVKNLKAITRGGYVTEAGDFFQTKGDYVRTHSTTPTRHGIEEVYECPDYFALRFINGDLLVLTHKPAQYKPQRVHEIKKACFTESHIVLLYQDGHMGYIGRNTGRCCSGLDKITDAVDVAAADNSTTIIKANGETITLPKRKSK